MNELLNSMPVAIYTLITAIFTISGTLLGVYFTNRGNTQRLVHQLEHERQTKRVQLVRDRLEELYVLAEEYANSVGGHYLPYMSVMAGELTYNQALDLTLQSGENGFPNYHRLGMLIDLYFPAVKPAFDNLIAARNEANEILSDHKRNYKKGDLDGRSFIRPLRDAITKIDQAAIQLKARIISNSETI